METAKIDIKQAVIKKDRLNVVYNERFTEANYTNKVTKYYASNPKRRKSTSQVLHHRALLKL